MTKPCIGITLGDPASIGPELCLRLLADPAVYQACRPLIIGDAAVLARAQGFPGMPALTLHPIDAVAQAAFTPGTVDILDTHPCDPQSVPVGQVSAAAGRAAFHYVRRAIELALSGEIHATVTNAISKEAIRLAGYPFAGHTEIYAHFTGAKRYAMLLIYGDMRVIHVSTHVSLREACQRVRKERVLEVIQLADAACRELGLPQGRIGVAGLNPHCGENGLFGREEIEEIAPAVAQAQGMGICAEGPIPPDTVFSKARGGWYDMVVAMYHDQGHIPLKLLGFVYDRAAGRWQAVDGVNITLGLPILRVSVDHGTAFDQAGRGTATEASLRSAVRCAAQLARRRFPS